jgi:hypothetical protein
VENVPVTWFIAGALPIMVSLGFSGGAALSRSVFIAIPCYSRLGTAVLLTSPVSFLIIIPGVVKNSPFSKVQFLSQFASKHL